MWSIVMALVVIVAGLAIAGLLAASRPSARPSLDDSETPFDERELAGIGTIGIPGAARRRRPTVLHD